MQRDDKPEKNKENNQGIKKRTRSKNAGRQPGSSTRQYMSYILTVLGTTNKDNPLTYAQIAQKVKDYHGSNMQINDKTVSAYLEDFADLLKKEPGKSLGFTIEPYKGPGGRNKGIYLEMNSAFTDDEMRLLIDSLVFSKCISYNHSKNLVDKIVRQSSKTFKEDFKKDSKQLPELHGENEELLYTYGIIKRAIKENKRIDFNFTVYGPNRTEETWSYDEVSPYEMVIVNSRFYMICAKKDGSPRHFRVDYMHDTVITEKEEKCTDGENRKKTKRAIPLNQIAGIKEYIKNTDGIDLEKYLPERPYMYTGDSVKVKFRIKSDYINQAYDWFGLKINDYDCKDDPGMREVTVWAVEDAILNWLLQYGRHVEVLEPTRLREKVRDAVIGMCGKYEIEIKEETKTGKLKEQKGNDKNGDE